MYNLTEVLENEYATTNVSMHKIYDDVFAKWYKCYKDDKCQMKGWVLKDSETDNKDIIIPKGALKGINVCHNIRGWRLCKMFSRNKEWVQVNSENSKSTRRFSVFGRAYPYKSKIDNELLRFSCFMNENVKTTTTNVTHTHKKKARQTQTKRI